MVTLEKSYRQSTAGHLISAFQARRRTSCRRPYRRWLRRNTERDFGFRNSDLGTHAESRWFPKSEIRNPKSEMIIVCLSSLQRSQVEERFRLLLFCPGMEIVTVAPASTADHFPFPRASSASGYC